MTTRIPPALRSNNRTILRYASNSISRYNTTKLACTNGSRIKTTRRRFFSSVRGDGGNSNETIGGVWLFHRHGDRTPARSIVADHMRDVEAAYWETKIPPRDRSYYEALSRRFPVRFQKRRRGGVGGDDCDGDGDDDEVETEAEAEDGFLDAGKAPYGFLTWKGMDQMYNVGKQIRIRYDPPEVDGAIEDRSTNDADFLSRWDVKVFSTRYLRTVMSVQCFLHGMTDGSTNDNATTPFYQKTTPESILSNQSTPSPPLQILVRHRLNDTLNSFDRNPSLMKSLVHSVISSPSFLTHDARAAPLAARLANYLPGLTHASSYGGPSGINWIHAADHFVCRRSHGLGLGEFGDGGEESEEVMEAMGEGVVRHLVWRFRRWYRSVGLLGAIAGPALGELAGQIGDAIDNDEGKKPPFVVYSCHDVTILGLLYGIGADFVASAEELKEAGILDELGDSEQRWHYWPEYASTLMFELVRVEEKTEGSGDVTRHVVRILLDGKPVRVMASIKDKKGMDSVAKTSKDGTDDSYDVPLSDFLEVMRELESLGKFDFEMSAGDNDVDRQKKKKRGCNVSTWTG